MGQSPRLLFTFGTLFEPDVISALLGYEPKHFPAILKDYAVYQGTKDDLPEEIKEDIKQKRDLENFVFLFAKKVDPSLHSQILGKAYYITQNDEHIIDLWERYPAWYQKEAVEAEDDQGRKHPAFVYVINKEGVLMHEFQRNPYELTSILKSAQTLHEKVMHDSGGK